LVAKDGRVLVGDFGVVGVAATDDRDVTPDEAVPNQQLTHEGTVVGTPGFIAPEYEAGMPADARSDQYAFCVSLDNALGGRAPRRIRQIVRRGLAADPAARHPSMQTLALALEKRSRFGLVAAAIGVAALATGLAVVSWSRPAAAPPCGGFSE